MKIFKIAIEEMTAGEFEVAAETGDEAMKIAKQKYRSGEFVMEPGEVHFKQMAITEPANAVTEWTEF